MTLDPLDMDEAMEKAILNCGLHVCDNDSMSMFEDFPNNELLELLSQTFKPQLNIAFSITSSIAKRSRITLR